MAARKKWSTTFSDAPGIPRRSHGSQVAAYRHVAVLAEQYHADLLRADLHRVTVWVDEGRGWERFETVRLADLPQQQKEST